MIVVRYHTRSEHADENQRFVEAVFAELAETRPDGLRYATLRLADDTFVHIADVQADPNPLTETAAFADFQRDLLARCEDGGGPNPQEATIVGAYGFDL